MTHFTVLTTVTPPTPSDPISNFPAGSQPSTFDGLQNRRQDPHKARLRSPEISALNAPTHPVIHLRTPASHARRRRSTRLASHEPVLISSPPTSDAAAPLQPQVEEPQLMPRRVPRRATHQLPRGRHAAAPAADELEVRVPFLVLCIDLRFDINGVVTARELRRCLLPVLPTTASSSPELDQASSSLSLSPSLIQSTTSA